MSLFSWFNVGIVLERQDHTSRVRQALSRSPVVALLGPRQCGKTTLAHQLAKDEPHHWFDLEDPATRQSLTNPSLVLRPLAGLVVLDEIQRAPDLFALLRVLADRRPLPARFLILGSSSPELIRHTSESLAGRIEFVELTASIYSKSGRK